MVLGGNAGAMGAATQAKRLRPDLEVVAFERGEHTSYSACGIPYFVGNEVESLERLVARSPEEHRERGIDARLRHEVVGIDLDRRVVHARDLAAEQDIEEPFDLLAIGLGAKARRPTIPGIDLPFVRGVATLEDGEALLHEAEQVQCKKVVVVGGGYIGLEMAEAFTRWGASAVVLDGGDQVMRTLDADMAKLDLRCNGTPGPSRAFGRSCNRLRGRSGVHRRRRVRGRHRRSRSRGGAEQRSRRSGRYRAGCARRHRRGRPSAHERGWCVGRGRLL